MITSQDEEFMKIALKEAEEGSIRGDFPVGAVLTIGGEFIGKGNNFNYTNGSWNDHAEASLIRAFAPAIQRNKKNDKLVEIYTTLEPCFMCLGTCVLNRIGRIIYACPDPNGGATGLDPKSLSGWYVKRWPVIEGGLFREESYKLLDDYMSSRESWQKTLSHFQKMHEGW